ELRHQEYLAQYPKTGDRYTQCCDVYREWRERRRVTMRQSHRAGEKFFVDDSGKKPVYSDPTPGERIEVELFVGVWGASHSTDAEATRTQHGSAWIASHQRAVTVLTGTPEAVVCDCLKRGGGVPGRYEPGLQRTYEDLIRHYRAVLLPARPGAATDNANVEAGGLVVQRWILARLRHETFFSLEALNARIAELVHELTRRKTRRLYPATRGEQFQRLDQPVLRPLPATPFEYGEWKIARVNLDDHLERLAHHYSVPFTLVHEPVDVRCTATTVEIVQRGERVATHRRSHVRGGHTTITAHMPKAHQAHAEWTPSRILDWAPAIGPETHALADEILRDRPHPEQGDRSCLGLSRLGRRYGKARLEAACARARAVGARSYRHVDAMLKHGLDRTPAPVQTALVATPAVSHEVVRGPAYYQPREEERDAEQSDGREIEGAEVPRPAGGLGGAAAGSEECVPGV
ncbi:MAG TPA: IS21 family transposase, partial [Acidimicrobiales bacterium]